ncbi:D-mannonate dehydratase ManD [Actinopolyspora halophila]|uniref:D-mannonate dehydratase ManD n=1 Tax=Actinopolyspora halophila TaxID=1850 RepID=UPI0003A058C5|nr:D-mannonate dehydratase ManD [Actinopolyspora halophila]
MKIVDAKVIVTSPGRNFVTVKITTEDGVTGVGDATLNGREMAVVGYLTEHVCPLLIGREASRIEDTWQYLYKGAYWRRGPVTMTAIAGIDTALWDIKGKVAGLPVYQLLGGRSRDGVMVYGHAQGSTIEETVDEVGRYLERGYRAVRAQTAIPGLPGTYGIGSDGERYEPASSGLPEETPWSTPAYLNHVPELFDRIRREHGYGFHLLHDAHHRMSPNEAAGLAKSLEPFRLFWLEDPTPAEDQTAFRRIREHSTTPLATGEVFNSIHDCERLISERLIDYIRTSVTHAGGITHLRRILSLAELYGVRSGSHGATDLSPVCLAAALHVDTAIPNFGVQEYMPHEERTDEVFPHSYRFADGHLYPSEEPGLGVDIDENAADSHPYEPAYLPVARLHDGSMHDW